MTGAPACDDYPTFLVGDRWRIVSPAREAPTDGRINLFLSRGAFGSGEHETTAACLDLLATADGVEGTEVLDLGSGTAILAIAALSLGARSAVCVDVDPDAIAVGVRNCVRNGVADRARHVHGTLALAPPGPYGLVLANVYVDVLRAEAERLVARSAPGAPLLLSGIPVGALYDIRARYEALGCRAEETRAHGDYGTLRLTRVGPR